jgi:hypothetical protein
MTSDDYIDNERHRKPARKVQGDQRPSLGHRRPPPKPRVRVSTWSKADELVKKYRGLAAKYAELAEQARASDYDDLEMNGSSRSEPMPSETVYHLMSDLARMIVHDLNETKDNTP